jgi:hypothetical protein
MVAHQPRWWLQTQGAVSNRFVVKREGRPEGQTNAMLAPLCRPARRVSHLSPIGQALDLTWSGRARPGLPPKLLAAPLSSSLPSKTGKLQIGKGPPRRKRTE